MRIRAATDGGAVRVELLNDVGASFAVAMFRPDFDGGDVVDQLEFLAASAREKPHANRRLDQHSKRSTIGSACARWSGITNSACELRVSTSR